MGNADAVTELAGALTILLRDLPSFRWAEWSTAIDVRWNRTRWRAFLDLALVPQQRAELRALLIFPGLPARVADYQGAIEHGYAGSAAITGAADNYQRLFTLLNAEIYWHRAAFPEAPTFVLHADLADFFPSIPHETLAVLCDALALPPDVAGFVRTYLRGPFAFEGAACAPERGIFPGHTFARALADALLVALDAHVARASGLTTLRFMDDIYLVAHDAGALDAAYRAIGEFCAAAGLALNAEKTAACRLGRPPGAEQDVPSALPAGRVRWAFLELEPESATWLPHEPAVEQFAAQLRARMLAPAPARKTAREYVAAVGYLVRGLAPLAPLDEGHPARLRAPLARVHAALDGPGRGIVALLRERLRERHGDLADVIATLPEAWFYWPITAGGLGVYNPASLLVGAAHGRAAWHPADPRATPDGGPPPPDDHAWSTEYRTRAQGSSLTIATPAASPAMEGRQRDFIARGGEVQGRPQHTLHAYWQWLIETHGPSLLEYFGTFRFLPTEVVPVQQVGTSTDALVHEDAASGDDDIPF